MKNIIFMLLFLGFISCQKEILSEPAITSAARSNKSPLVVSEERITTDNGGINFVSRNYFSNGQLVSSYGPEGPEAGVFNYTYDPAARTVTMTQTYHDIPQSVTTYHYNENNEIITVGEVMPGSEQTKTIVFSNGYPARQVKVFMDGTQKVEEEQLYTVQGKRLMKIRIREKRPGTDGSINVIERTLTNKSGSPFEYRMVSDDGLYYSYMRFSNKYFSPGYNIKMYPDVDLRTIHLSRSDVLWRSSEGGVVPYSWFMQGMLEMEYDTNIHGHRYHRWVSDMEANQEHQPVTFHRTYQTEPGYIFVTRFIYSYVRL